MGRPAVPRLLETEPSSDRGTQLACWHPPPVHTSPNSTCHPASVSPKKGQGWSSPICSEFLSTWSPCCPGLTQARSTTRKAAEKEQDRSKEAPSGRCSRDLSGWGGRGGDRKHSGRGSRQQPHWGAPRSHRQPSGGGSGGARLWWRWQGG